MVSSDGDLVTVWKRREPVNCCLDFGYRAIVREITGMDEQVAFRDFGGQTMSV